MDDTESGTGTGAMNNIRTGMLCRAGLCIAIMIVCIMVLVYYTMTSKVQKLNRDGWVLYYSSTCPHCIRLKNNLHWWTWMAMKKYNCSDPSVRCPSEVKTVPIWINKYTGQTWDGIGVFRA